MTETMLDNSYHSDHIAGCVGAWLFDIANMTEMECTSLLLAKSISKLYARSTNASGGSLAPQIDCPAPTGLKPPRARPPIPEALTPRSCQQIQDENLGQPSNLNTEADSAINGGAIGKPNEAPRPSVEANEIQSYGSSSDAPSCQLGAGQYNAAKVGHAIDDRVPTNRHQQCCIQTPSSSSNGSERSHSQEYVTRGRKLHSSEKRARNRTRIVSVPHGLSCHELAANQLQGATDVTDGDYAEIELSAEVESGDDRLNRHKTSGEVIRTQGTVDYPESSDSGRKIVTSRSEHDTLPSLAYTPYSIVQKSAKSANSKLVKPDITQQRFSLSPTTAPLAPKHTSLAQSNRLPQSLRNHNLKISKPSKHVVIIDPKDSPEYSSSNTSELFTPLAGAGSPHGSSKISLEHNSAEASNYRVDSWRSSNRTVSSATALASSTKNEYSEISRIRISSPTEVPPSHNLGAWLTDAAPPGLPGSDVTHESRCAILNSLAQTEPNLSVDSQVVAHRRQGSLRRYHLPIETSSSELSSGKKPARRSFGPDYPSCPPRASPEDSLISNSSSDDNCCSLSEKTRLQGKSNICNNGSSITNTAFNNSNFTDNAISNNGTSSALYNNNNKKNDNAVRGKLSSNHNASIRNITNDNHASTVSTTNRDNDTNGHPDSDYCSDQSKDDCLHRHKDVLKVWGEGLIYESEPEEFAPSRHCHQHQQQHQHRRQNPKFPADLEVKSIVDRGNKGMATVTIRPLNFNATPKPYPSGNRGNPLYSPSNDPTSIGEAVSEPRAEQLGRKCLDGSLGKNHVNIMVKKYNGKSSENNVNDNATSVVNNNHEGDDDFNRKSASGPSIGTAVKSNDNKKNDNRDNLENVKNKKNKSKTKQLPSITVNEDRESSLDSACGSSPVCSESRTNSPDPRMERDDASSNRSDTSSKSVGYGSENSDIKLPGYEECYDSIEKLLYYTSKMVTLLASLHDDGAGIELHGVGSNAGAKFKSQAQQFLGAAEWLSSAVSKQHKEALRGRLDLITNILLAKDSANFKPGHKSPLPHRIPLVDDTNRHMANLTEDLILSCASIICVYLASPPNWVAQVPGATSAPSTGKCLLSSALTHLAYCGLFGDVFCDFVVEKNGVKYLLNIAQRTAITDVQQRLLLRAVAVLCSVKESCLELVEVGGLDYIVGVLLNSNHWACTVEAAGVLAQLTAPCHNFNMGVPPFLAKIVARLLGIAEDCREADHFLLCTAALANLSLQHNQVTEYLYRNNAVQRLLNKYYFTKDGSSCEENSLITTSFARSCYCKDQIVTLLCRLSASGYEQMLVCQGGIGALLELVALADPENTELSGRIRSKAAVALGNIASTGYGLNAIHQHCGGLALQKCCELTDNTQIPVKLICKSLIERLEAVCDKETAV